MKVWYLCLLICAGIYAGNDRYEGLEGRALIEAIGRADVSTMPSYKLGEDPVINLLTAAKASLIGKQPVVVRFVYSNPAGAEYIVISPEEGQDALTRHEESVEDFNSRPGNQDPKKGCKVHLEFYVPKPEAKL